MLNNILKLKLISTTHWNYNVMIVKKMKYLQHSHTCAISFYQYNKAYNSGLDNFEIFPNIIT